MSRHSTKNYKPGATGSLRHLVLKVFCAVLLTAPYRLNYSTKGVNMRCPKFFHTKPKYLREFMRGLQVRV